MTKKKYCFFGVKHLEYKLACYWNVVDKYLKIFKIYNCRRMVKISQNDYVRNEILNRAKEGNIPQTIELRKANWIGHILRKNCLF
jgi:hypothetical protein